MIDIKRSIIHAGLAAIVAAGLAGCSSDREAVRPLRAMQKNGQYVDLQAKTTEILENRGQYSEAVVREAEALHEEAQVKLRDHYMAVIRQQVALGQTSEALASYNLAVESLPELADVPEVKQMVFKSQAADGQIDAALEVAKELTTSSAPEQIRAEAQWFVTRHAQLKRLEESLAIVEKQVTAIQDKTGIQYDNMAGPGACGAMTNDTLTPEDSEALSTYFRIRGEIEVLKTDLARAGTTGA